MQFKKKSSVRQELRIAPFEKIRGIDRNRTPAFSLVELLIVLGIVAILVSLVVPSLARTRGQARLVSNLGNCRQMGILVAAYANDNRELPPTLFSPVYVNPALNVPWTEAQIGKTTLRGAWFDNSISYHLLLRPLPPTGVLSAIEAPRGGKLVEIDGQRIPRLVHFALSDPFYAEPDYWTLDKQIGPEQWAPQKLTDVTFPSAKGLVFQPMLFGRAGFETGFPSCCADNVLAPVAWADLSGSDEVLGKLRFGVPNAWHHSTITPPTTGTKTNPFMGTEFGIRGRDR